MMRLRSLCSPANASVCAQTRGLRQLATACRAQDHSVHRGSGTGKPVFRDGKVRPLIISGQVFVRSWLSVLAVTTPYNPRKWTCPS